VRRLLIDSSADARDTSLRAGAARQPLWEAGHRQLARAWLQLHSEAHVRICGRGGG